MRSVEAMLKAIYRRRRKRRKKEEVQRTTRSEVVSVVAPFSLLFFSGAANEHDCTASFLVAVQLLQRLSSNSEQKVVGFLSTTSRARVAVEWW